MKLHELLSRQIIRPDMRFKCDGNDTIYKWDGERQAITDDHGCLACHNDIMFGEWELVNTEKSLSKWLKEMTVEQMMDALLTAYNLNTMWKRHGPLVLAQHIVQVMLHSDTLRWRLDVTGYRVYSKLDDGKFRIAESCTGLPHLAILRSFLYYAHYKGLIK